MMENQLEIWVPIKGYEGIYEISSYGSVKSLERIVTGRGGRQVIHAGRILAKVRVRSGYIKAHLYKNGKGKSISVHRLVAQHFLSNLKECDCVNHIDGNKENNRVDNLEWCTLSENAIHAINTGLRKTIKGIPRPANYKAVVQMDIYGHFIAEYESIQQASAKTGVPASNITMFLKGQLKQTKGYTWEYKSNYKQIISDLENLITKAA